MLVKFPFTFINLARASRLFAVSTSLIFKPVSSVNCAVAVILSSKAVLSVILPGTIVNDTVFAGQDTLTESDAFWCAVTCVLIAVLVNNSIDWRLLGENN